MPFKPGQSGCPGGQQSRRKTKAQIAISELVDKNSARLGQWLDEIYEKEGAKAAFSTFVNVVEFALPKLARKELVGDPDAPIETVNRVELVAGGNSTDPAPAKTD